MFFCVSFEGLLGQEVATESAHWPGEFPQDIQKNIMHKWMNNDVFHDHINHPVDLWIHLLLWCKNSTDCSSFGSWRKLKLFADNLVNLTQSLTLNSFWPMRKQCSIILRATIMLLELFEWILVCIWCSSFGWDLLRSVQFVHQGSKWSTVLIGYYDYHPVTKLPKIGYCDCFSNVPNSILLL